MWICFWLPAYMLSVKVLWWHCTTEICNLYTAIVTLSYCTRSLFVILCHYYMHVNSPLCSYRQQEETSNIGQIKCPYIYIYIYIHIHTHTHTQLVHTRESQRKTLKLRWKFKTQLDCLVSWQQSYSWFEEWPTVGSKVEECNMTAQ